MTNSKKEVTKLYVKRTKDEELVEIGYSNGRYWKLYLPKAKGTNLCDEMKKNSIMNRYYPGWFYYIGEILARTPIDIGYQHIEVEKDTVVGIYTRNGANYYYDDFRET